MCRRKRNTRSARGSSMRSAPDRQRPSPPRTPAVSRRRTPRTPRILSAMALSSNVLIGRSHREGQTGTMPHMISAPGAFAAGVAIFLIVLWDAFEAIMLPRRVTRKFRLARLFYRSTWTAWKFVICLIPKPKTREALLGFYGPLSLLVLVGV